VASGTELKKFDGHRNEVLSVAISPCGTKLASGGGKLGFGGDIDAGDCDIRVWSMETGECQQVLKAFVAPAAAGAFSSFSPAFGGGAAAQQPKQVSITDTDGDTMVFKLSADESRVEEWLNGALEIANVQQMQMDIETGVVRDEKGRFTVKPEERDEKLQALNALLGRVGVVIEPLQVAPAQTVYIDVDLNASEQQQQKAREEAGDRVREACGPMGADPEAALKKLAAVFAALPIGQTEQGQKASAALSCGLKAAKKGLSVAKQVVDSMHQDEEELPPRAPDPFEYAPTESAAAGDAGKPTTPERPEARAAPQGQWSKQLQQIREMGLEDVVSEWELVEIVEKHLGSLDRVVEVLIQRQLQKTDAMV